jgi:regulator of replication initiation timing
MAATVKQNKTTLEMLLHLQKLVEEFKNKVAEMDEELYAVKLENTLLKNKLSELASSLATSATSTTSTTLFSKKSITHLFS